MSNLLLDQVRAAQASMIEPGLACLSSSELDDIRCLVRLNVEFFHFLLEEDIVPSIEDKVWYVCDSVFSGVDSFGRVSAAYRSMAGARRTKLMFASNSVDSLKEEFVLKFDEFSKETDFENRLRLLLDLFRLQIVFAGLAYG